MTFTCQAPRASEIGYLLGKHPDSLFERGFSGGKVWAFYSEVSDERLTIALLTAIDAIGLVRGPAAFTNIGEYVNDRPYVASSLTSVALKTAFHGAMNGSAKTHTERLNEKLQWSVHLPAVASDTGSELITRLFAPLGYDTAITRLALDPQFPSWGEADLYDLRLEGAQTVRDVMSHLYVLLPVLDNTKHYRLDSNEAEKLLAHGGDWLASHPEKALITRRYLRYRHQMVASTLARLVAVEDEPTVDTENAEGEPQSEIVTEKPQSRKEREQGLHEQRLEAVMDAVRDCGASSLLDLGCGEGRLLRLALKESAIRRITGMDVSSQQLRFASRRLKLDEMHETQRQRLTIFQGSVLYRDRRFEGYDAAALVEVVEHLDPPRLGAMEQVVFAHARPRRVIITTPNREYNVTWEALGEQLRHRDHRFEWTRAEAQAWADHVVAMYPYRVERHDVGPVDATIGAPSQCLIFDRIDSPVTTREGGES